MAYIYPMPTIVADNYYRLRSIALYLLKRCVSLCSLLMTKKITKPSSSHPAKGIKSLTKSNGNNTYSIPKIRTKLVNKDILYFLLKTSRNMHPSVRLFLKSCQPSRIVFVPRAEVAFPIIYLPLITVQS